MEKLLTFSTKSEKGIFMHVLGQESKYLEKTASCYHPEIAAYVRDPRKIAGKTQLLITALGAGEYWGDNSNGDYFPEHDLAYPGEEYGHKTFETMANVYKHHQNKPAKGHRIYGSVVLSVYNPKFHRVELIVAIDNLAGQDIIERVNSGDWPEWSMGARVKYDVCSVCSNPAPKIEDYCEHLKYNMGGIDSDTGKKVYAINPKPKFFDISYVLVGADKTAKTLLKVANLHKKEGPLLGSAMLAKLSQDKKAEMEKEIPTGNPASGPDSTSQATMVETVKAMVELREREPALSKDLISDLCDRFSLQEILSTMMMMGIIPKPQETQRIVIVKAGRPDLADELDRCGVCFDPSVEQKIPNRMEAMISSQLFSPRASGMLMPMMEHRSAFNPLLPLRMMRYMQQNQEPSTPYQLVKIAKDYNNINEVLDEKRAPGIASSLGYMGIAALLHALVGKKAPTEVASNFDKILNMSPGMLVALGLGGKMIINQVKGPKKHPAHGIEMSPEVNRMPEHFKVAFQRTSLKQAVGIAGLGSLATNVAASSLQKDRDENPHIREGRIAKVVRQNADLISGAIAFDALLGTQGGGSLGLMRDTFHGAKKMLIPISRKFTKFASEQNHQLTKEAEDSDGRSKAEALSSILMWPRVLGKTGIAGRMVGGALDTAVIAGGKKLLSKKQDESKLKR
jgi:hypothetical protein